jgi:hypothetical protein
MCVFIYFFTFLPICICMHGCINVCFACAYVYVYAYLCIYKRTHMHVYMEQTLLHHAARAGADECIRILHGVLGIAEIDVNDRWNRTVRNVYVFMYGY